MNFSTSGRYAAASVQMLLTAYRACYLAVGVTREFRIQDNSVVLDLGESEYSMATSLLRKEPLVEIHEVDCGRSLARSKDARTTERLSIMKITASDLVNSTEPIVHANLVRMDADPVDLATSRWAGRLHSLDISRLGINDDFIEALFERGSFRNLRWLDLSANSAVTRKGVDALASAVSQGRLPRLDWLDLLGTGCDASPYIDGWNWRISQTAKILSRKHGFQRWMMLGSRLPEMEALEMLPPEERRTPPVR